ncbi:hypothetical protein [Streptomyces capoamus]|uniref:hypothetical protein n=1 Tax=Streptomyces capoamus TaxID=68183 RepID=UPI003394F650
MPGYRLLDLKEKLGGLRVYVGWPTGSGDLLRTLIAATEAEAERTCEFCGAPGRIRTRDDRPGGWRKAVYGTCHTAWSAHRIMIVPRVVRERGEAANPTAYRTAGLKKADQTDTRCPAGRHVINDRTVRCA